MRIRSWTMGVVTVGSVIGRLLAPGDATAEILTADRAVQVALQKSTQSVQAEASVLDARASLLGAYSGLLPNLSASATRSGSWTDHSQGSSAFGIQSFPFNTYDSEGYVTTPTVRAGWSVLNLSSWTSFRAAGAGLKAARHQRNSARSDIALGVRRQFYEVVQAVQIARVNTDALQLSRDDERRVRALFEVGSVSKSDVLKAQVRTAQSELDSLTSGHAVTVQRIALASALGIREQEMGDIDTVLTSEVRDIDERELLREAARSRPDLLAADAEARAAHSAVRAAKFLRLPSLRLDGDVTFNRRSTSKSEEDIGSGTRVAQGSFSETDRDIGAAVSLNWNVFDGLATDSRIASARSRYLRSKEAADALHRNLESEVHQTVLTFREAVERDRVARRGLESADENLNLTQQKYNVGSATILDLIDAQVQLQRARSQQVAALASIRVAEAALDRVRGRAE